MAGKQPHTQMLSGEEPKPPTQPQSSEDADTKHSQGLTQQRSPDTLQPSPGASPGQQASPIEAAVTFWRQSVREWYPDLHSKTYFLPPQHFNKVQYDVQTVADEQVLVPQKALEHCSKKPKPSDKPKPGQKPKSANFSNTSLPPQPSDPPIAPGIWLRQPFYPGPLHNVYDNDVRDDQAMQQVLDFIRVVAEREQEVMLVLSQLEFRKYLDNQVDPISAAAIRLPLPRSFNAKNMCRQGDFDVLMINARYGLIVGEVKSVGADPSKTPDMDTAVLKVIDKAIKQLDKGEAMLGHLVSDIKGKQTRITKILMLPNIKSEQLSHALSATPNVQKRLCICLGVEDTNVAAAVDRCLCQDDMVSSGWWQRAVTDKGSDTIMTRDLYEVLVARFCGPATTIEIPTIIPPRLAVGLRTQSEAVALTGLTMSMLTLYPDQVDLVNRPGLPRVFLWGPPGTGKTVLLAIKGMQWRQQGKDVHLVSSHRPSRAAILLIENQLQGSPKIGFTAMPASATLVHTPTPASTSSTPAPAPGPATSTPTPTPGPRLYTHFYDFEHSEEDVKAAVENLASAARDGEIFVIADEAFSGGEDSRPDPFNARGRFAEFCTHLSALISQLHLWGAAVERDVTTACLREELVTTPVRCPPAVLRHVTESNWIDGRNVPHYSRSAAPAPTDGPAVREIRHWDRGPWSTPSSGHTDGLPENCEGCADHIARLMEELRVGQSDRELQYRDTFILCDDPGDDLTVVTRLRARGLPVQVVTSRDDVAAIRDVVLAVRDAVTVTAYNVVRGLERRVVVVVGRGGLGVGVDDNRERLQAMSRSTSLLVWIG